MGEKVSIKRLFTMFMYMMILLLISLPVVESMHITVNEMVGVSFKSQSNLIYFPFSWQKYVVIPFRDKIILYNEEDGSIYNITGTGKFYGVGVCCNYLVTLYKSNYMYLLFLSPNGVKKSIRLPGSPNSYTSMYASGESIIVLGQGWILVIDGNNLEAYNMTIFINDSMFFPFFVSGGNNYYAVLGPALQWPSSKVYTLIIRFDPKTHSLDVYGAYPPLIGFFVHNNYMYSVLASGGESSLVIIPLSSINSEWSFIRISNGSAVFVGFEKGEPVIEINNNSRPLVLRLDPSSLVIGENNVSGLLDLGDMSPWYWSDSVKIISSPGGGLVAILNRVPNTYLIGSGNTVKRIERSNASINIYYYKQSVEKYAFRVGMTSTSLTEETQPSTSISIIRVNQSSLIPLISVDSLDILWNNGLVILGPGGNTTIQVTKGISNVTYMGTRIGTVLYSDGFVLFTPGVIKSIHNNGNRYELIVSDPRVSIHLFSNAKIYKDGEIVDLEKTYNSTSHFNEFDPYNLTIILGSSPERNPLGGKIRYNALEYLTEMIILLIVSGYLWMKLLYKSRNR